MSLDNAFAKVLAFHAGFGHPSRETPEMLAGPRVAMRYKWMFDELEEFREAPDISRQADAMIDLIYFALGVFVEMGIRPQPLFDIVHEANMKKLWPDGQAHYGEDGKVIKHHSWQDPDPLIQEELRNQIRAAAERHDQRNADATQGQLTVDH